MISPSSRVRKPRRSHAEVRRCEEKWCGNGVWRSSLVRLGQHSRKGARGNQEGEL